MKRIEELRKTPRLLIESVGIDGGKGAVHFPKWTGSVIWSFGGGWDHVSVAPYKRHIVPSWEDMCMLKDMFFREDEVVIQIHPAKSEYVNMVPNCLHLWKCQNQAQPVPNSLMVGLKPGQKISDYKEFKDMLEEEESMNL